MRYLFLANPILNSYCCVLSQSKVHRYLSISHSLVVSFYVRLTYKHEHIRTKRKHLMDGKLSMAQRTKMRVFAVERTKATSTK